jgi:hypothetical protein
MWISPLQISPQNKPPTPRVINIAENANIETPRQVETIVNRKKYIQFSRLNRDTRIEQLVV